MLAVSKGRAKKAFGSFSEINKSGCSLDRKWYSCCGSLNTGKILHGHAIKTGEITDSYTGNPILNIYAKCRELADARNLFDEMSQRDAASWNSLIAGNIQHGQIKIALELLKLMKKMGFGFDQYTFGSILRTAASAEDLNLGQQIHSVIEKTGFRGNVFCGSALVDMYAKNGKIDDAELVFELMVERNAVSWNAIIAGFTQNGDGETAFRFFNRMENQGERPDQATFASVLSALGELEFYQSVKQIHAKVIKHGQNLDTIIGNATIKAYSNCGSIRDSEWAFQGMKTKDLISWNSLLAAYVHNDQGDHCIKLFIKMQELGIKPDMYTLSSIISTCFEEEDAHQGKSFHGIVIKIGLESAIPVSNSLISMYVRSKSVDDALKHFNRMELKDYVSWNSLLSGFAQDGLGEETLKLFSLMQTYHIKIDHYAFSAVLRSCSDLAILQLGKQIHVSILKLGIGSNEFVGSSLIFMYARCGVIEDAKKSFEETGKTNSITWNSIIFGYAQHGKGEYALNLFDQMQETGVKPDHVTFVGVLSACSHTGLVKQGSNLLQSMDSSYGIPPRMEHYACAVDLFGRAGLLEEAMTLIESMPFKPNVMVWKTLLGACKIHGNIEMAKFAAGFLLDSDPEEHSTYVLLSNIYSFSRQWEEKAKIKREMKEKGLRKIPGWSWIEVKNEIHAFNAEDRSHPEANEIYERLRELMEEIVKLGYVPETRFVQHNSEEGDKEMDLWFHSEKLAVVFGILKLPDGATIRIMKNLRVCGDCHNAFKFISRAVGREIVMRDATRFHHFKDGACSCGEYW